MISLLGAIISLLAAIAALGCAGLCVKLYSEFVKEKKYREP